MTAVVSKGQPLRSLIPILFNKAGIPVEIQQHPWARAYRMALDESNIFIGPFLRTSERESRFKWLEVPAFTSRGFLYKLAFRKDISIDSLSETRKYKIGISRSYALPQDLINKGFDKQLEKVPTEELNIRKLYILSVSIFSELLYADRLPLILPR